MGKQHAPHLLKILEHNYEITTYWEEFFAEIYLAWDYNDKHANQTCCIYMNEYIQKMLLKYGHPRPSEAQLSPHTHCEVIYGAKEQLTHEDDTGPTLDNQGTKRIQSIFDAFLYYAREVDNK